MTDEANHERTDELLALGALAELTDAEEAELDAALRTDMGIAHRFRDELDTAAAVQQLAAETPPPELKAQIMAAIAQVKQEPHNAPQQRSSSRAAQRKVVDMTQWARRSRHGRALLATAAALMLVVAGVALVNRPEPAAPRAQAIIQADDAVTHSLGGSIGTVLRLVYSPSHHAIVLAGEGVPTLSDAQTYQLWSIDDSGPRSIGVFRPDDDGHLESRFEGVDPSGDIVAVTVEPASGSNQPTLPVVAST
jgi:Anti-sigma-K factor rskA